MKSYYFAFFAFLQFIGFISIISKKLLIIKMTFRFSRFKVFFVSLPDIGNPTSGENINNFQEFNED